MMRAGQWVPIGPFQVCPDHDEGAAVLIYDEQTRELHVSPGIGPFRIRVRAGQCGATVPFYVDEVLREAPIQCDLAAGHEGAHGGETGFPGVRTTWGESAPLLAARCGLRCSVAGVVYACERTRYHGGAHLGGGDSAEAGMAEWGGKDGTAPPVVRSRSISAHYEDLGRQGMEALADTMASLDAGPRCDIAPPPGFARCTRAFGHNGPCAMPEVEPCRRVSLGTMMARYDKDKRRCWQPKGHAGSCGPFLLAPPALAHPTSRPEQG